MPAPAPNPLRRAHMRRENLKRSSRATELQRAEADLAYIDVLVERTVDQLTALNLERAAKKARVAELGGAA